MATRIVRDNCKDCTSSCEHAGKDREFVCVKGVSCKTVKPKTEMVDVVRCKDCAKDGLLTCPMCYIESNELIFINHDPEFFCAYGERKDGDGNG